MLSDILTKKTDITHECFYLVFKMYYLLASHLFIFLELVNSAEAVCGEQAT